MKIITIATTGTVTAIAALGLSACADVNVTADVDSDTQALIDRVAVEDMVVEYYAHLGGGEAGAFGDYFAEGAVFDVNGLIATGREEIEDLYGAIGEGDDAIGSRGKFHMLLSNPVIKVDGDSATAQFVWTGVLNSEIGEPPVIVEQGREYDQLTKVEGKWLFTHRVVVADSGMPELYAATYEARPNFSFDAE